VVRPYGRNVVRISAGLRRIVGCIAEVTGRIIDRHADNSRIRACRDRLPDIERPRATRASRLRLVSRLWRDHGEIESAGQPELGSLPGGFHLPLDQSRACKLDVAICNIKSGVADPWWYAKAAKNVHRAWRDHGGYGPQYMDTRKQFDQVYEAILGLMGAAPRKN
jgi:hypothetical protein